METAVVSVFSLKLVSEPTTLEQAYLETPAAVASLAQKLVGDRDREVLGVLYLSTRHELMGYSIAYVGGLARSVCEPRGIYVPALLMNAAVVLLFHNHPSGNPQPSPEDIRSTLQLREAGEILGVTLLDHVIVGPRGSWTSLREQGAF